MAFSVNCKGRSYYRGKSIDESLRGSVIDSITAEGGDPASGFFPGKFSDVANRFRVSTQFVSKLWQNLCATGDHLKQEKPSLPYKSVKDVLGNYSTLDGGTSLTAIGNVIRNKLPEGPYTRKRLTKGTCGNNYPCEHSLLSTVSKYFECFATRKT